MFNIFNKIDTEAIENDTSGDRISRKYLPASIGLFFLLILSGFMFFMSGKLITRELLFNSDSLYAAALFNDLEKGGKYILNWKLPPAPYIFPDLSLFFYPEYFSRQPMIL